MKQRNPILAIMLLLLSACAGNNSEQTQAAPQPDKAPPLPKANLPITNNAWTTWYCANGNTLRTRYGDQHGTTLQLEISNQSGTQQLQREPSLNPVVYSNANLGFYSDGLYAAVGRPLSDELYFGGCSVR